jgi:Holliday junction resolvase RusA-like endonuclease
VSSVTFEIPGVPVAQPRQRHRIVKSAGKAFVSNYTPKTDPVNVFKAVARIEAAKAFASVSSYVEAVSVDLVFVLPRTKGQVWKSKPMPRLHHTKKPDLDNLEKSVLDALTGIAWIDDAQVQRVTKEKWIASGDELPRVIVKIEGKGAKSCRDDQA